MPTPPIDPAKRRIVEQLVREGRLSVRSMAEKSGLSVGSVSKIRSEMHAAVKLHEPGDWSDDVPDALPDPAPEAGGPRLPDPVEQNYDPFVVDTPGVWGVLSDTHFPCHDKPTIESFSRECRERGAKGILLNGDVMDMFGVAPYFREPDKVSFLDEIETGRQFFAWLRARHPKARIVFKEGNHDFRLTRYVVERAAALYELPELRLNNLLHCDKYGIEFVKDKRVVNLGKLPVVHGHEFRGGGGVNPARWLFLRAISSGMCGHFHRSSQHFEPGLDRRVHGVWSVGCACFLYPQYDPTNKWNHGYALVDVAQDGGFSVTNRVILRDGRVV